MFQTGSNENKKIGVLRNRLTDKLRISIPKSQQIATKRENILSYMVSIYDPLGIRSPYRILGKVIYSEFVRRKSLISY